MPSESPADLAPVAGDAHDAELPAAVRAARILVAIVNYKTSALVVDCLASLASEAELLPNMRVVVVDNDSGDGSAALIGGAIASAGHGRWAELVAAPRNGGFSYGNNVAIRPAFEGEGPPPDFVLLLNPDTLVRPRAVAELATFLSQHADVGIAGSRLEDPDGTQQVSRYRFYSLGSELDSGFRLGLLTRLLKRWQVSPPLTNEAHEIDWVAGASMMVRREVFEQIGFFDEDYFLYFEEVDFCLRSSRAGWKCWYVPASRVVHLVGKASGITNTKEPARRRPRYWFESRRRYFVKNHGRLMTLLIDAAWLLGFASWRLRRKLTGKPDEDPPHMLADFVRYGLVSRGR